MNNMIVHVEMVMISCCMRSRSLEHSLVSQDLGVDLVLNECCVAVVEVDACSLDALGELGTLDAVGNFRTVAEVAQERVVNCGFVVVHCLRRGRHQ